MPIDIKQLTEDDVGRGVIYRSAGGDKVEDGRISSWNYRFIFVRYGRSQTGAATRPQDLEWEHPKS